MSIFAEINMKSTDKTPNIITAEFTETSVAEVKVERRNGKCVVALIAFIVALAAWAVLMYDGIAALGISAVGLVLAIVGEGANRRAMRNFATTALIASGVLLVVVAAFLMVIHWGLGSI